MLDPDGKTKYELIRIDSVDDLSRWSGYSNRELKWLCGSVNNRVDHYRIRNFKKRNGLLRLVESPKAKLKQIQREILHDIIADVPIHSSAHGFCPGKSILTFATPHVGMANILKMDLRDFFPSIAGGRTRGLFQSFGFPSDVAGILTDLCVNTIRDDELRRFTSNFSRNIQSRFQRLFSTPHLPQGAPTSPNLANLAAYRMDLRLSALADSFEYNYTRYADDLVFSSESRKISGSFASAVSKIVFDENFEVNFRKTKWMSHSHRQKIVGLIVNQKINVGRESFDELKATLNNCLRLGPASQNRQQLHNFREHLRGRIAWIGLVNKNRGEKLLQLFDQITWNLDDSTVAD